MSKHIDDYRYFINLIKEAYPLSVPRLRRWFKKVPRRVHLDDPKDPEEVFFAVQKVANSAHDMHFGVQFDASIIGLPVYADVVVKYDGKAMKVVMGPLKGRRVVRINDMSPERYLDKLMKSYGGVPGVPAWRIDRCCYTFFTYPHQNHPHIKTFITKGGGHVVRHKYADHVTKDRKYFDHIYDEDNSPTMPSVKRAGSKLIFRIPTFQMGTKEEKGFLKMVTITAKTDAREIIVDLRGNTGGLARLADQLACVLFGYSFYDKGAGTYTRTSSATLGSLKELYNEYLGIYGKNNEMVKNIRRHIDITKRHIKAHHKYMFDPPPPGECAKSFRGKTTVLYDHWSASASLLFLDTAVRASAKMKGISACDDVTFNARGFSLPNTGVTVLIPVSYWADRSYRDNDMYYRDGKLVKPMPS